MALLAPALPAPETLGQSNYTPYTFTTLAGLAGSAGSADGTGSDARFSSPFCVAVDSAGKVYVTDEENHTIRKVTPAGVVTTLAGLARSFGSADGIGSDARFFVPVGVAVDSAGNVYVADFGNDTIRKVTPPGVVTTLAGLAGTSGSADGTGSAARFNSPYGVAVDGAGNVYVADESNQTIRKVTAAAVVTTLAGLARSIGSADGTGSAAQFSTPRGVAVDSSGNVYVADYLNSTIRKVAPTGVVTTLAGVAGSIGSADGMGSAARFNGPEAVAVDSAGNVYVADSRNYTIRKVTPTGMVTTLAGLAGSGGSADGTGSAARFHYLSGVSVDGGGNVYVADRENQTIRKGVPSAVAPSINTQPQSQTVAPCSDVTFTVVASGMPPVSYQWRFNGGDIAGATNSNLVLPSGPGRAGDYQVVVSDAGGAATSSIAKLTLDLSGAGTLEYTFTTLAGSARNRGTTDGTGSAARFSSPTCVAVDSAGNVYVTDEFNQTIRKVTPAGVVTTLAGLAGSSGSADGIGSDARFRLPVGVAVDSAGNVYVADSFNYTIRKVTPAGMVTTLAGLAGSFGSGDGTGNAARFDYPYGVAVDSAGNVYVADEFNSTIRKVTTAGVVTTLAGLARSIGSADGMGSAAQFYSPRGVALDSAGNVYVVDYLNSTIRKVTPQGVVTTLAGLARSVGNADGMGSAARFNGAEAVAVDSAGNVYVADSFNYTIRKVTPAGMVTTLAGLAGRSGIADGTGSAARFDCPSGVSVDSGGNVYVADRENHTIRKGVPSAVAPSVTSQPQSQTNNVRTTVTFNTDAIGTAPLIYQWRFNGANIIGATTATLNLSDVQLAQAGNYDVVVGNCAGTVVSQPAQLTVLAPNTSPKISPIADQITPENTPTAAVAFTVSDAETPAASLQIVVSSSNAGLLPIGNIALGGTGTNRTVTLTPAANESGQTTVTLTVTDGGGLSASTSFVLKVTPSNRPPSVVITTPVNGAVFPKGATIAISAQAADLDGTVSRVEFYAGSTLLGAATTGPYSYSWSDVPVGNYVLTAKAFDDQGASTVSGAVNIVVSDITGEVAIIRNGDDPEISQVQAYLLDLGFESRIFEQAELTLQVLTNFSLVIWDDLGAGGLTDSTVQLLARINEAGKPLYLIGEHLAEATSSLTPAQVAQWTSLTHLQSAGGPGGNGTISINVPADDLVVGRGRVGAVSDFAYPPLAHPAKQSEPNNANVTVVGQASEFDVLLEYENPVNEVRTFTQMTRVISGTDTDSIGQRKTLFENAVWWLLHLNNNCGAVDLAVELTGSEAATTGQLLTYTLSAIHSSGECEGIGVRLVYLLPPNTFFLGAESTFGTWTQGNGRVTFNVGHIDKISTISVTVVVMPTAPGAITNVVVLINGGPEARDDNNTASLVTMVEVGAQPLLALSRLFGGQPQIEVRGAPGHRYTVEASEDFVGWTAVTNFVSTSSTTLLRDATTGNRRQRFYRAKSD